MHRPKAVAVVAMLVATFVPGPSASAAVLVATAEGTLRWAPTSWDDTYVLEAQGSTDRLVLVERLGDQPREVDADADIAIFTDVIDPSGAGASAADGWMRFTATDGGWVVDLLLDDCAVVYGAMGVSAQCRAGGDGVDTHGVLVLEGTPAATTLGGGTFRAQLTTCPSPCP